MSSVSIKSARLFIKLILFTLFSFSSLKVKAWEVDFSRRKIDFQSVQDQSRLPASQESTENLSLVEQIFDPQEIPQDIVILATEKGFIPDEVRLKKNGTYRIHVVNVNSERKNTSFVLDAFSEFHGTPYGTQKTFQVIPKKEGVFAFTSPEVGLRGKLVIYERPRRQIANQKD